MTQSKYTKWFSSESVEIKSYEDIKNAVYKDYENNCIKSLPSSEIKPVDFGTNPDTGHKILSYANITGKGLTTGKWVNTSYGIEFIPEYDGNGGYWIDGTYVDSSGGSLDASGNYYSKEEKENAK